jgi:hypothetical protein
VARARTERADDWLHSVRVVSRPQGRSARSRARRCGVEHLGGRPVMMTNAPSATNLPATARPMGLAHDDRHFTVQPHQSAHPPDMSALADGPEVVDGSSSPCPRPSASPLGHFLPVKSRALGIGRLNPGSGKRHLVADAGPFLRVDVDGRASEHARLTALTVPTAMSPAPSSRPSPDGRDLRWDLPPDGFVMCDSGVPSEDPLSGQ